MVCIRTSALAGVAAQLTGQSLDAFANVSPSERAVVQGLVALFVGKACSTRRNLGPLISAASVALVYFAQASALHAAISTRALSSDLPTL